MRENEEVDPDTEESAFDKRAVARLNEITAATGAKIVLSTSWARPHSAAYLAELFARVGILGEVIGRTPRNPIASEKRAFEIQSWLTGNPVHAFIILEDAHEMGELEARTVRTTWGHGLLDEHVEKAIALLEEVR